MRGTNLFVVPALLVVLCLYAGSNEAARWITQRDFHIACDIQFLALTCNYGADTGFNPTAYAVLAAVLIVIMAVAHVFFREHAATLFLELMGAIGVGTIAYDSVFRLPVLSNEGIINDTENILAFAIFASFGLVLAILRKGQISLLALAAAAIVSYAVKIAMMIAFLSFRPNVMGATELYLLYVSYAFGTFTLHLMTVTSVVARTSFPSTPQEA